MGLVVIATLLDIKPIGNVRKVGFSFPNIAPHFPDIAIESHFCLTQTFLFGIFVLLRTRAETNCKKNGFGGESLQNAPV